MFSLLITVITVLQLAVDKMDSDLIKLFLKYDVTVDTESYFKSASNGYLALIQKASIDVNSKDDQGESAMYMAAEKGHLRIVEFLVVEKHADVNATTNKGKTALWIAANSNKRDVATFLLAHGSDPLTIDEDMFLKAAGAGKVAIIEQATSIDVNCKNSSGSTALMLAAEKGHSKVIEQLLLMGADVHQRRSTKVSSTGKTALDICLLTPSRKVNSSKSAVCCELLLAHGATFTVFDEFSFVNAAKLGILVLVQQIIEKKGEQGDTEITSRKNEPSIFGFKENWGSRALVAAAETGKLPIIQVNNNKLSIFLIVTFINLCLTTIYLHSSPSFLTPIHRSIFVNMELISIDVIPLTIKHL